MGKPKKYYAVARGRKPGIYTAWFGPDGAEAQVRGYAGARYKGFATLDEAREWIQNPSYAGAPARTARLSAQCETVETPPDAIFVHTDGSSRGNPGPGGYAAVIVYQNQRTELSRGFARTTNNRMELMACIAALEAIETPSDIVLHSDSRYVVNGISLGWARKWQANNWMRTKSERAENCDLWARLLELCEFHRVQFVWVRGHAGHPENERCDALAVRAAEGKNLEPDEAYMKGRTCPLTESDERAK